MKKVAVSLVLALTACSGDGPSLPPLTSATTRITIVGGNNQSTPVAQQLPEPLVVKVTDEDGNPRQGVLLNFVVPDAECGRPFAGSAVTDAQGEARERWDLGTRAKKCQMEARAVDQKTGTPLVFATFEATAVA
ncbi:MAG TPA: hypothetical protein VF625_10530, partial [Longimicrobium sp.]